MDAVAHLAPTVGVVAACAFALVSGKLSFKLLHASAEATARNTAMLGLILFGAYVQEVGFRVLETSQCFFRPTAAQRHTT